ncbi:MAG: STAS domain-containing protein [Candidatus Cloacimonetes bacterium]|nr:STAS domain-containing protein [Candidatus Cloacimonadota bacterium]
MEIMLSFDVQKALMKIEGTVTSDNAYTFKDKLSEVLESEAVLLELDLSSCHNISSSGIGKLLIFYKEFMSRDGRIEITKSSPIVYELLTTIKLDQLFTINL